MENMKSKYDELSELFFKENDTINADTLSAFLQKWAWKLYDIYDKDCKREDIKCELEDMEKTATDDEIDAILDKYEDILDNEDSWHYCLQSAIDWVLEDDDDNDGEEE